MDFCCGGDGWGGLLGEVGEQLHYWRWEISCCIAGGVGRAAALLEVGRSAALLGEVGEQLHYWGRWEDSCIAGGGVRFRLERIRWVGRRA